ncbi:MAG: hypothetical protein ACLP9L_02440 [Thermoguttaceae bacterium]
MDQALSLRQVAELLKLQHYRIAYAIVTHRIPEPAIRVANKRVFQQADIKAVAAHFGVTYPAVEPQATTAN